MYVDTSCSSASPVRLQRADGIVRVALRQSGDATRLATLFQEGCAKARMPRPFAGAAPEAILINTAGGLTGGDRLTTEVDLQAGAAAVITTQACERIYRSTGNDASIKNRLKIAAGARLAWLPQETILFDGGRLSRHLDVDLEGDAQFLAVEAVLLGRKARGETVDSGLLHDRWRVRRDGKLVYADDLRLSGEIAAAAARPSALGPACAFATLLLVGPEAPSRLDEARRIVGTMGGVSCWDGKLVARLVAETGLALRRVLEPLLTFFLAGQPLPRVWHI